jgi:hypothetical protein
MPSFILPFASTPFKIPAQDFFTALTITAKLIPLNAMQTKNDIFNIDDIDLSSIRPTVRMERHDVPIVTGPLTPIRALD